MGDTTIDIGVPAKLELLDYGLADDVWNAAE